MSPSRWEVLACVQKLNVGCLQMGAHFSIHISGAYGTKGQIQEFLLANLHKSATLSHNTVHWTGGERRTRKRAEVLYPVDIGSESPQETQAYTIGH